MEDQLEVPELMSLKKMALRGVIVHLLNFSDILASLSKFKHITHEIEGEWRETIEPMIKGEVSALNLPDSLVREMIEMARPIGLQIKRWKDRQDHHFRREKMCLFHQKTIVPLPPKFCWTRTGLIDYPKTAKELVRCNALDVVLRFKIACINCLEDDIRLLWERLPKKEKTNFYDVVRNRRNSSPGLQFIWPYIIKDKPWGLNYLLKKSEGSYLTSVNQWAFEEAAKKGNKMATEFFLQKLTHEERESSFLRTVMNLYIIFLSSPEYLRESWYSDELAEVYFHLVSVMTPEQRTFVFMAPDGWPVSGLSVFLDWPWPNLFLENKQNFWSLIPPIFYDDLYWEMFRRLENSDLYLPKLFPELYKQSPLDFKKRFLELECQSSSRCFLRVFLESEDLRAILSILRNVDAAGTERLLHRDSVFVYFNRNILADKRRAVELCLRNAKLPGHIGKTLKEIYKGVVVADPQFDEGEKRKFKRFFEYLEGTGVSIDKERIAKKHKLKNCFVLIKKLCPGPGDGERPET